MFEELESAGHPLLTTLASISTALDDAQSYPTLSLQQGQAEDAIRALHVLGNRVESLYLRTLRVRDDRLPQVGAVTGTAAWAADALHISRGQANADVRAAYVLDAEVSPGTRGQRYAGCLPQLGQALAEGTVSREHVDVAVRTLTQIPTDVLRASGEQVDATLTEESARFSPKDTATLAAHLLSILAPDGMDLDDDTAYDRRDLRVSARRDGMLGVSGQLDPVGGAEVKTTLDWLADPARFTGDDGTLLVRTPGERYADALTEMARRAAASIESDHPAGEGPRIVVITTPEQLTHTPSEPAADPGAGPGHGRGARSAAFWAGVHSGADTTAADAWAADITAHAAAEGGAQAGTQTGAQAGAGAQSTDTSAEPAEPADEPPVWCSAGRAAGLATCEATGPLSPRTLHTLACDATMDRVVLDRAGAVQRMETLARPATRAMRRALAARDGGCAFDGCGAPASWCDAHHVVYWSRGGRTVIDNLVLLCRHHHTVIHREQWQIRMIEGVPWFIPPASLDSERRPRRNTVHVEIDHVRRVAYALRHGLPLPERPATPQTPLWGDDPPDLAARRDRNADHRDDGDDGWPGAQRA